MDCECGSLAIAFASGGMMWFGGCDVPAPFPSNRFLPLSFLKKKQITSEKIGNSAFFQGDDKIKPEGISAPINPPYLLTAMSLNLQNDPYLSRCVAVALQLNVVISWRPASLKAKGKSKWLKQQLDITSLRVRTFLIFPDFWDQALQLTCSLKFKKKT